MGKFSFVDLFAGIGGFRLGLEKIGGVCIASSEIESKAMETYRRNWPNDADSHNLGDITYIKKIKKHDLLVGGVPCQPWSIAGKNRGFEDDRGQLWNDVIRLVSSSKPRAFIFENVKGLVDPRHIEYLKHILNSFREAGYDVQYKLLNSHDYGVPQNRDRVFIVGTYKKYTKKIFEWPEYIQHHQKLHDIFEGIKPPQSKNNSSPIQRDMFGERTNMSFNKLTSKDQRNAFFILTDIRNGPTSIHSWDFKPTTKREKFICMTILKNRRRPQYGPCDGNPMSFSDIKALIHDLDEDELIKLIKKEILRQYEEDKRYEFVNRRLSGGIGGVYRIYLPECTFFSTLTATGIKDVIATESVSGKSDSEYKSNFITDILIPKNYRTISALEALRLQGFPKKFKLPESESVSKRLLGNAVAVPIISFLGKSLEQTGVFKKN